MQLSTQLLKQNQSFTASFPAPEYFNLPEKVLQFGTGVLLRGLPDYFIDKANKNGIFNGRIVVVKSTGGDTKNFEAQDSLYTHCIRGISDGKIVKEDIINASISRVLSAQSDWQTILECAGNPQLQLIISNTTEVGIALTEDDIFAKPPTSFPGKLLAFLYKRFEVFNGDETKGLVVVPTELLPGNADKLKDILNELAKQNKLEKIFINWLNNHNHFCNSLVDRIVPGKLPEEQQKEAEKTLGYSDELMIISEPYALWAIQCNNEKIRDILSFSKADESVVLSPDISSYRELKLRLLNGSHTFSCGLALLAGFNTVKESMDNAVFAAYLQSLMQHEIAPAITSENIAAADANAFASKVSDRFRNPYIEHKWINICLQYSSKMAMRNAPVIHSSIQRTGAVPAHMVLGYAAHILFMKCEAANNEFYTTINNKNYPVKDDHSAFYCDAWKAAEPAKTVTQILGNKALWGKDLNELKNFANDVTAQLQILQNEGATAAMKKLQ